MNNHDNNRRIDAPNANDFLGGSYLRKEDLDGPVTVTIKAVWQEMLEDERRPKLVVGFREFEKPLILNKTNIRVLVNAFRTGDTAVWNGQLELYVDPNVEHKGQIVGGIRVKRLRENERRPIANGHARGERYDNGEADYGF